MKSRIQRAETSDIPIILRLAERCYPVAYKGLHSDEQNEYMMREMYNTDTLKNQIQKGTVYLLLYQGEEAVGYCAYTLRHDQKVLYLDKLYIMPCCQGRGMGKALMEEVMRVAHETWPKGGHVRLDVNRDNRAKAFYEHLGFEAGPYWERPIGRGFRMHGYTMELKFQGCEG